MPNYLRSGILLNYLFLLFINLLYMMYVFWGKGEKNAHWNFLPLFLIVRERLKSKFILNYLAIESECYSEKAISGGS